MDDLASIFREKLISNGVVGGWQQISSIGVTRALSCNEFDFIVFDLEHGMFSLEGLAACSSIAESRQIFPMARLRNATPAVIGSVLDNGAQGLIFANVTTGNYLRDLIGSARFSPHGARGVGYHFSNGYGAEFDRYFAVSANLPVLAMIECREGVENIEEITSVAGLDGVLIGPYDLSCSLGITGDFNHPLFVSAIEKIQSVCENSGTPIGMHFVSVDFDDMINTWKSQAEKYKFIALGTDGMALSRILRS